MIVDLRFLSVHQGQREDQSLKKANLIVRNWRSKVFEVLEDVEQFRTKSKTLLSINTLGLGAEAAAAAAATDEQDRGIRCFGRFCSLIY